MNSGNYNSSRPPQRRQQPLSTREKAILAERQRVIANNRKKRLRAKFDKFVAVMVFSLIGLAISLGVLFTFIHLDFNKNPKEAKYGVMIAENGDIDTAQLLAEESFSYTNGAHYVSLSALSKKFGFVLSGDVKKMTLSLSENDSAVFSVGSQSVCINGTYVSLESPSYFSKGEVFVPASFFSDYITGVKSEFEKKGTSKHICLIFPEENISFSVKSTSLTQKPENIDIDELPGNAYTLDLSEYEQYMNPENKDEYLFLVNLDNRLDKNYIPDDLVDVMQTRKDRNYQKMRKAAAMSLEAMFKELYAAGYTDVTVTSAYRSYDYQQVLFDNQVALFGGDEAAAAKAVTYPGSSEHQSGLCADLHNLGSASVAFANQDAFKWLYSHCADFGFILRYPKDKTDITGIMYEPWHYRFVGRYHARKIMRDGLCLEEYVENLNS